MRSPSACPRVHAHSFARAGPARSLLKSHRRVHVRYQICAAPRECSRTSVERNVGMLRRLSLPRLGGDRIAVSGLRGARAGAHSERSVDAPAAAWAAEDGAERRAHRRPITYEQLLTPQTF